MTDILEEVFGTTDPAAQGASLDAYKSALRESHAEAADGRTWLATQTIGTEGTSQGYVIQKGLRPDKRALLVENLAKSLTPEQTAALTNDLAVLQQTFVGDVQKDWTPANPVGGTGLTAYDLEAPAKRLVPKYTPLRNTINRAKGQGNARRFKRIDSFTNAGIPGGAASALPFFSSLTATQAFGPVALNRPPKINYTGSDWTVGYVELGFSDAVSYIAQFQGLGFDNVRELSQTAVLYAHLMGEERAMLYGRGATGNGYGGIVAAPGSVTTATATTGGTIPAATYSIYVTASTGGGESAISTVATQVTTGATSTITITIGTEPTGAINYNVYMGTTAGINNAHFQGNFAGNVIVLTSYNSTSATIAGTDNSFQANGFDGFLTVQSDPTKTGYLRRLNGLMDATNPGAELDLAFLTMFQNNGADPDEVWMTGSIRTALAQNMRKGGSTGYGPGYRTNLQTGDGNVIMGTAVSGIVNSNTNKVVDLKTHRFMPTGALLIRSTSLPIQDSNIPAPVQMVNVQDYMAIDWPQIQMSYDVSTYQIGTMLHYAPAWSGLILGATN